MATRTIHTAPDGARFAVERVGGSDHEWFLLLEKADEGGQWWAQWTTIDDCDTEQQAVAATIRLLREREEYLAEQSAENAWLVAAEYDPEAQEDLWREF